MKYRNHLVAIMIIATGAGLATAAEPAQLEVPQAIELVEPEVPYNFIRWGVTGDVEIAFEINEEGHTEKVTIVSATNKQYGDLAKEAVAQWKFEKPAVAGVEYHVPIRFK